MNKIKYIKYFLALLFVSQVPRGLFGMQFKPLPLINKGATCYINAVMQSLFTIEPFVKILLQNKGYYKPNTISSEFIRMLKTYQDIHSQEIFVKAFEERGLPFLSEFYEQTFKMLGLQADDEYSYLIQQDATEFLTNLLDGLLDNDIDNSKNASATYKKSLNDLIKIGLDQNLNNVLTKFPNLKLIDLPIVSGSSNLKDCLDEYFKAEDVSYEDKILKKRFILTETSDYLIISLKRNKFTGKDFTNIAFDLFDLDLSNYYVNNVNNLNCKYELVGLVSHAGSLNAGHYIAHIKLNNGQWYLCNDKLIRSIKDYIIQGIAFSGLYDSGILGLFNPTIFIYKKQNQNNALFNDSKKGGFLTLDTNNNNYNDLVNKKKQNGVLDLYQAIKEKKIDEIKHLLESADVNKDQKNLNGQNPLEYAFGLGLGYEDVIEFLLPYYSM